MSKFCFSVGCFLWSRGALVVLMGMTCLGLCFGCGREDGAETVLLDTVGGAEVGVDGMESEGLADGGALALTESSGGGTVNDAGGGSAAGTGSGAGGDMTDAGNGVPERAGDETLESQVPERSGKIFVYVCGNVRHPGVYEMADGARIFEAVEAAGGLLETADASAVNLAACAMDQMQIYIPSLEETAGKEASEYIRTGEADEVGSNAGVQGGDTDSQGSAGAAGARININSAAETELTMLPGIGPSKAKDIIEYRETHGAFSSVEELMNIPGIKSGVFDKIKDKVTVD